MTGRYPDNRVLTDEVAVTLVLVAAALWWVAGFLGSIVLVGTYLAPLLPDPVAALALTVVPGLLTGGYALLVRAMERRL